MRVRGAVGSWRRALRGSCAGVHTQPDVDKIATPLCQAKRVLSAGLGADESGVEVQAWAGVQAWAAKASGSSRNYRGEVGQSLTQRLVAMQETLRALADAASWPGDSPEMELAGVGTGAGMGLHGGDDAGMAEEQRGGLAGTVSELLEGVWNMGVPKSKVSPSRKRMKHLQHVPDPVNWYKCTRCGEAKRPHRICTTHMDVCALSDEDYAKRVNSAGEGNSSTGQSS